MKKSKEFIKGTVILDKTRNEIDLLSNEYLGIIQYLNFDLLCDNFEDAFFDLLQNVNCDFEDYKVLIDTYLDIFRCSDRLELRFVYTNSKLNVINFNFELSCNSLDFLYDITFSLDEKDISFFVYDASDYSIVNAVFGFLSKNIDSLFNVPIDSLFSFPQREEENTSEPEQPVEDAEEQDSPELTPLELAVFEALEECVNLEYEYIYNSLKSNGEQEQKFLKLASDEAFKQDVFKYLISKAGLEETYQSWFSERKEQEAVGVSK